jgi:uncharacterized membrane protein
MTHYIISLTLLFLSHALLSWPQVRKKLVGFFPKPVFYTLYSAISLAALFAVIHSYQQFDDYIPLYEPVLAIRPWVVACMPIAFFFMVCRISSPYPKTSVPYGIYRVSRFPGSVGIVLWALLHLLSVGDTKRVLLFVCMIVIAVFAMVKNTLQMKQSSPALLKNTSIIPFMKMPRDTIVSAFKEIGFVRIVASLALYGCALLLHEHLLGVNPLGGL